MKGANKHKARTNANEAPCRASPSGRLGGL
jgi:hypothetical protein